MTNENQPTLEQMLLDLSGETEILKNLGKSKSIEEQSNLYDIAAQMISQEKNGENHERVIKELTRDPIYAYMQIEGHRDNFAQSIQDLYKEGKGKIAKDIESKINNNLRQAKNKATASIILANYLTDILIKTPEVTQDEVDGIEREEIYKMRLPYAFEARGSVEGYKNLELRKAASKYLTETKDGDEVKYSINSEKLKEVMEDVIKGASLYGRTLTIERQMQEAQKKAKAA